MEKAALSESGLFDLTAPANQALQAANCSASSSTPL
jgi:hypothetical protein